MSGRQAAILVPTTILAQQHFNSIAERFAAFPVRVGLLSRFRSAKEQRDVVRRLATGECDVVVGTHRMLQKDIAFKDLGLVVIDEEHRFGVGHKEKLKQLRVMVDVLTMSATPIPRTLHMALSGARDMSLIHTPPINRSPVKTFVGEFKLPLVRTAILHEIERGGQIYFLHNRVETIEQMVYELKQLVPEARIIYGHGQMGERELENVMLSFMAHEFDILVCTTIIESGLDIPNANTIIINEADRFGLAQLYQLRGRVGRSDVQAYCYCLYKPQKSNYRIGAKPIEGYSRIHFTWFRISNCVARYGDSGRRKYPRRRTAWTHGLRWFRPLLQTVGRVGYGTEGRRESITRVGQSNRHQRYGVHSGNIHSRQPAAIA